MERMRHLITESRIPWVLLFLVTRSALADSDVERTLSDVTHIVNGYSGGSGHAVCPRADTLVAANDSDPAKDPLKRIAGALEMADQMPGGQLQSSPERVSVNKFCDNVPIRFPDDSLLSSNCKVYREARASTRDKARDLLFSEIKRKTGARELLLSYTRQALDDRYRQCVKARGDTAPSLGEMKASAVPSAWQGTAGKNIESTVRYGGSADSQGATGNAR